MLRMVLSPEQFYPNYVQHNKIDVRTPSPIIHRKTMPEMKLSTKARRAQQFRNYVAREAYRIKPNTLNAYKRIPRFNPVWDSPVKHSSLSIRKLKKDPKIVRVLSPAQPPSPNPTINKINMEILPKNITQRKLNDYIAPQFDDDVSMNETENSVSKQLDLDTVTDTDLSATIGFQDPQDVNAPHGLNNLGNTCYVNSVVQTLFSFDFFINDLLKICPVDPKESVIGTDDNCSSIIQSLLTLNKVYYDGSININDCLNKLKQCIGIQIKHFSSDDQQDAAEFFTFLLDLLKKEIDKKIIQMSLNVPNPVDRYFEFTLSAEAKCSQCEKLYEQAIPDHHSNTIHLQLNSNPDIQSALFKYLNQEKLPTKCNNCDSHYVLEKNFIELPKILFFQLGRYSYDGSKNEEKINVPHILYLPKQFIKPKGSLSPLSTPYKSSLKKSFDLINKNKSTCTTTIFSSLSSNMARPVRRKLDFNQNYGDENGNNTEPNLLNDDDENQDPQINQIVAKEDHHQQQKENQQTSSFSFGVAECEKYQLVSIICHHGPSLVFGHFTSYVFNFDNQKWFYCNDHNVSEVSFDDVLRESQITGYCYFYAHTVT